MSNSNGIINRRRNPRQEQMRMQKILKMNATIDTAELKSPRKRANSECVESPSKKFKDQLNLGNDSTGSRNVESSPAAKKISSFSLKTNTFSTPKPKGSTEEVPKNKQLSRTLDDEKIERNLSKSWVDIIDDLAEQETELNDYVKRVVEKYKLDREEVLKNTECDVETLKKRQKLINYGKVTQEYKNYTESITKNKRKTYHPRTPNKFRKCSRRKFDGLIKKWRKQLHMWDETPEKLEAVAAADGESDDGDFNYDLSSIGNYTSPSNGSSQQEDFSLNKENEASGDVLELHVPNSEDL